jgi:hypothetical protein
LALCSTVSAFTEPPLPPTPVYTVDLREYFAPQKATLFRSGALAFLTDHTVAIDSCSSDECRLGVLDLAVSPPRLVAQTLGPPYETGLRRAPDGGLIIAGRVRHGLLGAIVYGPDLRVGQTVDGVFDVSPTGKTFYTFTGKNGWSIGRFADPEHPILTGKGMLLGFSDTAAIFRDQGLAHLEDMQGKLLTDLPEAGGPNSGTIAHFVGDDKILLEQSHLAMVNLKGQVLYRRKRLDGWGVRIGQSDDGSRILFDRFTRHIGLLRNIGEYAVAFATLGVGVEDEVSNGEQVTVIDAPTGKPCFTWSSRSELLPEGDYHADIDPSGKLVAIMTSTTLFVYRLPEGCVAN